MGRFLHKTYYLVFFNDCSIYLKNKDYTKYKLHNPSLKYIFSILSLPDVRANPCAVTLDEDP